MLKKLVGIEMSSRYLRAVEIDDLDKKTPVVKKYYEKPIEPGIVKDGEVLDSDLMTHALKELWSEAKFTTKDVVMGIGNQRVLVRNKTISGVNPEFIKRTLTFLVEKELPIPVDESILDFYPIERNEENGDVEGLLIAAVKSIVQSNVKPFERARLNLVRIDLIPFALIRGLIDESKNETTIILLSIGSKSTSITIVDKGTPIFIRFIPAGVEDILDNLQKTGLSYSDSLTMLNTLGLGSSLATDDVNKNYRKIINEQVNALYQSIRNTLKYYQTQNPEKRYKSIVMVGHGIKIPGLKATFNQAFGIPVEIGEPTLRVKVAREIESADLVEYSIPIGLTLGAQNGK